MAFHEAFHGLGGIADRGDSLPESVQRVGKTLSLVKQLSRHDEGGEIPGQFVQLGPQEVGSFELAVEKAEALHEALQDIEVIGKKAGGALENLAGLGVLLLVEVCLPDVEQGKVVFRSPCDDALEHLNSPFGKPLLQECRAQVDQDIDVVGV